MSRGHSDYHLLCSGDSVARLFSGGCSKEHLPGLSSLLQKESRTKSCPHKRRSELPGEQVGSCHCPRPRDHRVVFTVWGRRLFVGRCGGQGREPAAIPHTWREDGHICLTIEARTLRDFLSANSHRAGLGGEDSVKGMLPDLSSSPAPQ